MFIVTISMAFAGVSAAGPQLVVIDATPTPTAGGTALIIALANITDASASKPYVIRMDPGIYDVGAARVQLKAFVDLEGSGQASTIIQGSGNPGPNYSAGVLMGANSMELRELQVRCLGAPGQSAIALYNGLASPTLRNVTINSSGGDANWGIRNQGSSPLIEEATIAASGGQVAYGVVNTSFSPPSVPRIRRSGISALGSTTATGIYSDQGSAPGELRDVKVVAGGSSTSYGVYVADTGGFASTTQVFGSALVGSGGSSANYGLYLNGSTTTFVIQQSEVRANGNQSYGIRNLSGSVVVTNSRVFGATRAISALGGFAHIGLTQLDGGYEPSGIQCVAVYDQNLQFIPGPNCP